MLHRGEGWRIVADLAGKYRCPIDAGARKRQAGDRDVVSGF
jgi:hypothetical protein